MSSPCPWNEKISGSLPGCGADGAKTSASRLSPSTVHVTTSARSSARATTAAATALTGELRLTRERVGVLGVHVGVDRLIANAVPVLVHVSHRLLKEARR